MMAYCVCMHATLRCISVCYVSQTVQCYMIAVITCYMLQRVLQCIYTYSEWMRVLCTKPIITAAA
jgi:hypothetical protein